MERVGRSVTGSCLALALRRSDSEFVFSVVGGQPLTMFSVAYQRCPGQFPSLYHHALYYTPRASFLIFIHRSIPTASARGYRYYTYIDLNTLF